MADSTNRFGQFLRQQRLNRGLSIKQLSVDAGVSNGFLSMVETGERKPPSPEILHRLVGPLGVDYQMLMTKAGYLGQLDSETNRKTMIPPSYACAPFYPEWIPGLPVSEQVAEGCIPLPIGVSGGKEGYFYTLATDDDMKEIGIRKGQRILVAITSEVDGELVFCEINSDPLVRRIFRIDEGIVCQGLSKDVPPIIIEPSRFRSLGRVVSFEQTI